MRVVTLDAGERCVLALLPETLVAGDSVSGRIDVRSIEATDETLPAMLGERLEGWTMAFGDRSAPVTDGSFTFPIHAGASRITLELLDPTRRRVAFAELDDVLPPDRVTERPDSVWCPSPGIFTFPGRFDGDLRNTKVRIWGQDVEVFCESSRALVLAAPANLPSGRAELVIDDAGAISRASVVVLGLSWHPRTADVQEGATFLVHVDVAGVAELPLDLRPVIRLSTWIDRDDSEEMLLTVHSRLAVDGKASFAKRVRASHAGTFRSLAMFLTDG